MEEEEDPPLPPDDLRCRRTDGKQWRCKNPKQHGSIYCHHHHHSRRHAKTEKRKRVQESGEIGQNKKKKIKKIKKIKKMEEIPDVPMKEEKRTGDVISFWSDRWCGDKTLQQEFPRLFDISNNQLGSIYSHLRRDGETSSWNLGFRRGLKDWEMDLVASLLERIGEPPKFGVDEEEESHFWTLYLPKIDRVALDSAEGSASKKRASSSHDKAKLCAIERAEEVQANLDCRFPSFVKSLHPSHTSFKFWVGLPFDFCKEYLPRKNVWITLVNENQEEFPVEYVGRRMQLCAGWKAFSIAHNLVEGDALVFQLVKPTEFEVYIIRAYFAAKIGVQDADALEKSIDSCKSTKMSEETAEIPLTTFEEAGGKPRCCSEEVYIVNAYSATKIDGVIGLQNLDPLQEKTESSKCTKLSEETVERLHRTLTSTTFEQGGKSRNGSEEVGSDAVGTIKFLRPNVEFKNIKSRESFTIVVHGLVIDSELSEQARLKYYELCCSQQAFLHENLPEIVNLKMAAGLISQTVNISDYIRASKLSTSLEGFAEWDKNLGAFEQLGMNVGFLRARIKKLVGIICESEKRVDSKRGVELKAGSDDVKQEIKTLKSKLVELNEACKRFDVEIETHEVKAKHYELKFASEVDTPW